MKTIFEPSVYVLGRTELDQTELDRFLADHGVSWQTDTDVGAEVVMESAGRVCYMSFAKPRPGGNRAYLDHIKEVGHGSVLEHPVWNLMLTGVSRSLSHELVRHRAGFAYSQLSQRYVDESVAEYVVPPDLQKEVGLVEHMRKHWPTENLAGFGEVPRHLSFAEMRELLAGSPYEQLPDDDLPELMSIGSLWLCTVRDSHEAYVTLGNYLARKAEKRGLAGTEARKFARQAARSVLPNATETKLVVSGNGRALRHFIEMRASRHADPEIRQLAYAIWLKLKEEAPNLFSDYEEVHLPDGTVELTTPYRKV